MWYLISEGEVFPFMTQQYIYAYETVYCISSVDHVFIACVCYKNVLKTIL